MKIKSEAKVFIITVIIVLFIWCLYINFIYSESIDSSMDVCKEHMNASTKICNFRGGLL
jgi:hypothetical protein